MKVEVYSSVEEMNNATEARSISPVVSLIQCLDLLDLYAALNKNNWVELQSSDAIEWIELNVQPEHIQGTAKIPMNMTPSEALQYLKGISAKLFFEFHERARLRYPRGHLWSRGKFASSVGFVQLDVVQNYVKNQNEHHGNCGL